MHYMLFKRQSKIKFNTKWENIKDKSDTFKKCFAKLKKECETIAKRASAWGSQESTQFEIRQYKADRWGEEVVWKKKRYNAKMEEIK